MSEGENISKPRECGACTACCTAVAVFELRKPVGEKCRHVSHKGCGTYASRPSECQMFECLWLRGHFAIHDRPDKLGAVFFEEVSIDPNEKLIGCAETTPGTHRQERVMTIIHSLVEPKTSVVVRNFKYVVKFRNDQRPIKVKIDPKCRFRVTLKDQ
jgi:hypothetical protein